MKPLVTTKVKRGEVLDEWEKSESQLTDAGRNAFWERQQARMRLAQADRSEAAEKVRTLRKSK